MMTKEEIKAEREKIVDEMERLKGLLDIEKAKLKALQRRCKHPDEKTGYSFGEMEVYCPDCGMSS